MAGQETETEKVTWESAPVASSSYRGFEAIGDLEKPAQTPNRLLKVSSTAIRSVQHSFRKVSCVSTRLYRNSWPKVRSRTVRIYQNVSPKVSSASARLYQRSWLKIRHESPETSSTIVRLPCRDQLEVTSMTLRLFQLVSALYVFLCVTESFRSKITYDGRVRQIQPIMLTTLIYSSLVIACFLLLNVVKKLRASTWHIVAVTSIPGDVSMICLFIAKDVILGVHSFECAATQGTVSAIQQYGDLQNMDALELRGFYNNRPSHGAFIASARDVCLVPSSVYVVCVVTALSYLGSVAVTVRQLLHHRKSVSYVGDGQYPGHVEQAVPVIVSRPPQMMQPGWPLFETRPSRSEPTSSSYASRSSAPLLPPPGPPSQDPKYANLPAGLVESMAILHPQASEGTTSPTDLDEYVESDDVPPRASQETTGSMDPDQYMVSDGFRPCGRPPSYTSSRESSQGPPEYRSRPPSLHTVVLVGP